MITWIAPQFHRKSWSEAKIVAKSEKSGVSGIPVISKTQKNDVTKIQFRKNCVANVSNLKTTTHTVLVDTFFKRIFHVFKLSQLFWKLRQGLALQDKNLI